MSSSYYNYYESSGLLHGSMLNIMGTRFDILIVVDNIVIGENIWNDIKFELLRLNKIFNRFDKMSEVSQVNNCNSSCIVSAEMMKILVDCKRYHAQTLGLFDVTRKNFDNVLLVEQSKSVSFLDEDISIDFGGIAKGYAVEKINDILKKRKIKNSFCNFGNSSIYGLGANPQGDFWLVGVENPNNKDEIWGEFNLKNEALSTSGNIPLNSRHIINPFTGSYIDEKKIVCVKTKNSIDAEVLSTTLMIAKKEESKRILNNFDVSDILIRKF
ncbi:MAG: FAD:protein FMN transferase [Paludibacter sp.]|nr:FAD:protein FMN transferase [Paludibacter sp.]MDD4199350.1 FAD:protein FMN transferase [Paludibacter sp.]MDD4427801.1 FAD:protein FMN transferase [Paludibacter sp.]